MLDKLFYVYAGSEQTWVKNAIHRQLHDVLPIEIISHLLARGNDKLNDSEYLNISSRHHVLIRTAIENGELKGMHVNQHEKYTADCVNKDDFKQWLIEKNEWPIDDNLLKYWWDDVSSLEEKKINFYNDFLNREKLTPEISTKLILDINPYLPDDSIDKTKHLEYLNLLDKINEACESKILVTEEYTYLDFEPNLNSIMSVKEFLQRKKVEYTGYEIFTHSLITWCDHQSINIDKRTKKTNQITNHFQDNEDREEIISEQGNGLGRNEKRASAIKIHLQKLEETAQAKSLHFDKKKLLCSKEMLLKWVKEKNHRPNNLFDMKQSTFDDFWRIYVPEYQCCAPASVNENFFKEIQG